MITKHSYYAKESIDPLKTGFSGMGHYLITEYKILGIIPIFTSKIQTGKS
jgi:hypothetical protein